MNKIRRRTWIINGVLAALLLLVGAIAVGTVGQSIEDPEEIRTVAVERGSVVATVSASGELIAPTDVVLDFAAGGRLVEVLVQPGDRVAVGDALAKVDDTDARAQQASARAGVAAAQAGLDRLLNRLTPAQQSLGGSQIAAASQQVEAAQAAVQAAIEQLGKPGDANALVQQALASVETARLNLERATVRAPEAGVVTGVQLDKGNFAGAGQAQMTFIATHNIWIQADFKENNLGHLDPGDAVDIVFDAYPGRVFPGTVREIGFGVDVGNPPLGKLPSIKNDNNWLRSAQRFPVLIDFELPLDREQQTRLKVGSQATVVVYTGTHPLFNLLARLYMRALSILTYAY